MIAAAAEGVRPAERLTVSESAAKYRHINQPGAYVGLWLNEKTPYLREPMDLLSSTMYTGMIFVGPAQSGKTDMFLNWLQYRVRCDPADMMLVEKSQAAARDFSQRRIDRLHRDNSDVRERMIQRRDADNTYDKKYRSGMILNMSWPTINEGSGRSIPNLWLSDYDRMDQDINGEGTPFDLFRKRATIFKRNGMTVAESSPGFLVTNTNWIAKTPHEAPPTQGILNLYNRGDRRRWLWKCVNRKCRMAFEPDFSCLWYPKSEDLMESAEAAMMECPSCKTRYPYDSGALPGKHEMNNNARWLKDGQFWLPSGEIKVRESGLLRSDIASFWLKGPAAFPTWQELVFKFLTAEREWTEQGSEGALKTTVQTDQALPYTPKAQLEARLPETIKARAKPLGNRVVPLGVRLLIACIDVQKNRFVVQVHGIGVGGDVWIIDRYEVRKSNRLDPDGEHYWVNPGSYLEDWKLLVAQVLTKTYPLGDESGRSMAIKLTMCDSGGREGVTSNAYNFVRWLRDGREYENVDGTEPVEEGEYEWTPGLVQRFLLLRGDPTPRAPRVRMTTPDSQRKDRHAGARGEIPVLAINSDLIKDAVDKQLDRTASRGGRINFPDWLDDKFYKELTVEIRDPLTGKWDNPKKERNESWDLLCYAYAAGLTQRAPFAQMNWNEPYAWAEEWDHNELVFSPATAGKSFEPVSEPQYDLRALAARLA